MKTRLMVGAFLTYEDQILLIHRSITKKHAPGMWSCIGGHMEADELNNPLTACYREVKEETGINQTLIENLILRYITIRHTDDEIRTGYYFVGNIMEKIELPICNEGTLHWVNLLDMDEKPMTFSIKQISTHWYNNLYDNSIMLCGINRENDKRVCQEFCANGLAS